MEDYLDMMTTDFRPALTKAKSLNPDIIVGGTWFFMSVLTMKQMVELGFYPPAIFLADGSDFSFVDPSAGVGPQGNGVFFTEPYPGSSIPELRGRDGDYLEEQYKLAMNRSADYFSGVCFSAVQVLAQAIEAAGTVDTDAVRQALFTKEFNTAIWSRTVFNEFGVQKYFKPLAAQWQDNKKEIVWPSDYATAKPIYPYVPVK
jgi:branched-chain amino acid transport system substrate-binding protein